MNKMAMRFVGAFAVLLMSASYGLSEVRVATERRTYPVAGRTGAELFASMRKKAPKRTIFTQDLAQYTLRFTVRHNFRIDGNICLIQGGTFNVRVVATYPRATDKLLPKTQRIWTRLLANMHRIEEARIRIARQSMNDLMKATVGLKASDDLTCTKIRRPLNRLARQAYADHDARQKRLDGQSELSASGWSLLQQLGADK